MRAKLVEHINFERGQDPFDAMNIGKNRKDGTFTDKDFQELRELNMSRIKIWDILEKDFTFESKYKWAKKNGLLTLTSFQGIKTYSRKFFNQVPGMLNNIIIDYIKEKR
jgi:hypothetical protein